MKITLNVDLEKFRYSLVGDGYILEEVIDMTEEQLVKILQERIYYHIEREYEKGKRIGLYI